MATKVEKERDDIRKLTDILSVLRQADSLHETALRKWFELYPANKTTLHQCVLTVSHVERAIRGCKARVYDEVFK